MEVPTSDSVVDITGLTVDFEVDKQWVPAVKGVSLSVAKGEVLAIVGESGSGNRLPPWPSRPCCRPARAFAAA